MSRRRQDALQAMAHAVESPNEAYVARRALARQDPVLGPITEAIEAWERLHGPCPDCGHGYSRHVGFTCYGERGLMAVVVNGRRLAAETISPCPCHTQALESGWVQHT